MNGNLHTVDTLKRVRHPLVSAIGGVSSALEHLPTNPQLSERLLRLALQKLTSLMDYTEKEILGGVDEK